MTPAQTSSFMTITGKVASDPILAAGSKAMNMIAMADHLLADPSNGAAQVTTLYNFVKALDPNTAVREGEIGLVNQVSSHMQTIENLIAKIGSSRVVHPDVAASMANETKMLAGLLQQEATRKNNFYQAWAQTAGVGNAYMDFIGLQGSLNANTAGQTSINESDPRVQELRNYGASDDEIRELLGKTSDLSTSQNGSIGTLSLGGKTVTVSNTIADRLAKADAEMYAATGQHISVNQSYRTYEQQAELYRTLKPKGAQVAPPGSSYHEKGLAVDVTNWQAAQPYLNKYGLVNPMSNDKGHFSYGEFA